MPARIRNATGAKRKGNGERRNLFYWHSLVEQLGDLAAPFCWNEKFKVKAVKIGNSIRMTILKEIADYLTIKETDTLLVSVTDHTINVRKKA